MSNDLQFSFKKMEMVKSSIRPSCREGHSLVYLATTDQLLLFGGMCLQRENEVFLLDLGEYKWK